MASLCIDITSTPTFPSSNTDSYNTVEVEANSSYTNASLKMIVPPSEILPVTISNLKVVGLPENLIATYFLPSGEAYDPSKKSIVVQPGQDGPSIKISGKLSDVYDNNRVFKISISFSALCGSSEISDVELNWFAIKTKKTSSNTFLVVAIIVAVTVFVLIVFIGLLFYYFKNKNSFDTKREQQQQIFVSTNPNLKFNTQSLSSVTKPSLYYKFI